MVVGASRWIRRIGSSRRRRRATKKPAVPWTCGSVCRNSGRRAWRNRGHSSASVRIDLEPGSVDDLLRLVGVDRADRVDDRAARADPLGCGTQELELELRQRLCAPAQVGATVQDTEAGAGCIHERVVEAGELCAGARGRRRRRPERSRRRDGARSPPARERAPSLISTAVTSPASIVALPPGAAHRSSVRSPGRAPTVRPDELRRSALRPDAALGRAPPRGSGRRATRPGRRDRAFPRSRRSRVGRPSDQAR